MSKEIDNNILQIYQLKKLLGSGAYGHVWKVIDRITSKDMALKKIYGAFLNDVDAQRTYRQITVLHQLSHPNIIKLYKVHKAKNNSDLYLVFQFMQSDLQSLVGQSVLEDVHIRYVIYQILRALKYLHSAQLIHRDLKPSNILINTSCEIKICDFGLVRSLTHEQDQPMILSQEVATRWYRSPEMLLGSKTYGKQTDIWSVGCILAQLIMGQPIFPGDSTLSQLQKILEFTGIPSTQNINALQSQSAQNLINQLSINRKSYQQHFKKANKEIITLITQMLQFNPKKRITIDQALSLSLFNQFKTYASTSDICTKFIVPHLDDNIRLSLTQYRKMIYCDIDRRYPQNTHNYHLLDKLTQKQNKRGTRSHHSPTRKKSAQNIRNINSSLHARSSHKKQSSLLSVNQQQQKNKKNKKQYKKSNSPHNQLNNNTIFQNSRLSHVQAPIYINNKVQSFYKVKQINNHNPLNNNNNSKARQPNTLLTKVRSRKIMYKSSKSIQKLQNSKSTMNLVDKKKVIR